MGQSTPEKLPDGSIIWSGFNTDITERKNALINLAESEQRYHDLVDHLPEMVFEIDLQGKLLFANLKSFEVTGYSREDFQRGVNILDIFSPEDKQKGKENLRKAFSETNLEINEYTLVKKDGTRFPVSAKSIPIVKNGEIIGVRGIVIDLTEYKKNQELLVTLNEKLRVVGGLTRHDVANKLMVAKANLFLLEKNLGDNFELRKYIDGIKSAVTQSAEILNFSNIYEKVGSKERVEVDVGKLFYVATMRFSDLKSIEVINECYGLNVVADSFLSQLLLYNLVDNSLKHGERVTQIRLHFEKSKDGVKLFYEDNGVGISVDNKFKLFLEGFTTGAGSGIGLKLIKRMIEVHGWTITEEGTPGVGAKFIITIPKKSP